MELFGINPYVLVSAARARADQDRIGGVRFRCSCAINGEPAARSRGASNMMPAGDGVTLFVSATGVVRCAYRKRWLATECGDRRSKFDTAYRGGPATACRPSWFRTPLHRECCSECARGPRCRRAGRRRSSAISIRAQVGCSARSESREAALGDDAVPGSEGSASPARSW